MKNSHVNLFVDLKLNSIDRQNCMEIEKVAYLQLLKLVTFFFNNGNHDDAF